MISEAWVKRELYDRELERNARLEREVAELREMHAKLGKTMLEYERLFLVAVHNINDADDLLQQEILGAINRK